MSFRCVLMKLPELPIVEVLGELRAALTAAGAVVLEAPPGAGKSTVVPLALLDEPWLAGRRILMLESRRLAARTVAARMAATLGESVGETVGYRMRLETKVSAATRIEVITEGVLNRMLQSDPALEQVALVIFDEFHERSLNADSGLAFCIDARTALDSDLKLLVMSATLDGLAISKLLGDAPVVSSRGRMFPVEIRHLGTGLPILPGGADSPERAVGLATLRALRECEGDILVFLPGSREIRRVGEFLAGAPECNTAAVEVLPLHGELPPAQQDAVLQSVPGVRRVILATNIAETSLTLPGIRVVIDSGLVRRSIFDPVSGMSRLETRHISRASAEQRAGRAGRVAAGICYRLWSAGSAASLAAYTTPEILEADLTPLALELAEWGVDDANRLCWSDPPPAAVLAAARETLQRLAVLDEQGRITVHGKDMARFPAHPRIAHMLLQSVHHGEERLAADLAAILGERDFLRRSRSSDIEERLEALRTTNRVADVDGRVLQRLRRVAEQFLRMLRGRESRAASDGLGAGGLLALAYPDRIGQRRSSSGGRFLLTNGRGASFIAVERLAQADYIVAVDLDDRDREARITLAVELSRGDLERLAATRIRRERQVDWSAQDEAIVAREIQRLDALILDEKPLRDLQPAETVAAMVKGIKTLGLAALPWDADARALCARAELARRLQLPGTANWPEMSDAALENALADWLAPWLDGVTRRGHLARISLIDALRFRLGSDAIRDLDQWLPTHLTLPTGSRVRIDYGDDLAPSASMRMQEVFGLATTPRLALGRIPVTFKLLSPAQRPLQVTADLESFWRNAYSEVRKDMRGRYPRHYWPLDPLQAEPTRRVKPRSG